VANATIRVLAGTNGSGKSSIGGALMRASGVDYFNPDEVARSILAEQPSVSTQEANAQAWATGKHLLERAIAERINFRFETTLGGNTITQRLEHAADKGLEVRIWYVGLSSPELHLERVRARVARGGHDIPEADIRRRYQTSQLNLIRLMPKLRELKVFDNSEEGAPSKRGPRPKLVLHLERGRIRGPKNLKRTPKWARAIVAAALGLVHR
jgi:predicted ABC-type ATPase